MAESSEDQDSAMRYGMIWKFAIVEKRNKIFHNPLEM